MVEVGFPELLVAAQTSHGSYNSLARFENHALRRFDSNSISPEAVERDGNVTTL